MIRRTAGRARVRPLLRVLAPSVALLVPAAPAGAQEAAPAIVVTGRGLDAPDGDAAYSTVTIDPARVDLTASGRIEDALRDVAGLAQFRRSDARAAHPTSQGVTLRGLGGNAASRALVLLDGVPQADPFGGWVAFPAYLPERLGAIRVTRGGGSGEAGPGALAGTIELASIAPPATGLRASAAAGSRASVDTRAAALFPLGPGYLMAAGQAARGDGFVPVARGQRGAVDRAAPYAQASLALRALVPLGATTELQANVAGVADRRDRGVAFTRVRSEGMDASVRLVGNGGTGFAALAYVQARALASGFASVGAGRASVAPALDQFNVPATAIGGRFEVRPRIGAVALRAGADLRHVAGRTQERYAFTGTSPARLRQAGGASTTAGAFAGASLATGPVTLDAGLRLDRWRMAPGVLFEAPLAGGAPVTEQRFAPRAGWEPSGRFGVALRAGEARLRAAAYRGWRLPTLNELYRPFRVGADATAANAALSPERLWGAEAGGGWDGGAIAISATAYWNRLDRAIANVTLAAGPGTFPGVGFVSAAGSYRQRRNLDAITARGLEADARLRHRRWSLAASWALTDSRVAASDAAAALDELRPAQTATHAGSATLGWAAGAARAAITARYVGPQFEDDQNGRQLASAFTLDALARVPLGAGFAAELRAENLTDARVEAGIAADGTVELATPRTFWIALVYRGGAAMSASNSAR